jgi:6-pyruvoyltetrahydropterin/6-carboxytetrahydropterin synthase
MKIIKKYSWDMAHRLPNHSGKCRNLHGHTYTIEVCLEGGIIEKDGISSQGMLLDFSDLKKIVGDAVVDKLDHSCVVWNKDKALMDFYKANPDLKHVIVDFTTTAENLTKWAYFTIKPLIPDKYSTGLSLAWVRLHETQSSAAFYDDRGEANVS